MAELFNKTPFSVQVVPLIDKGGHSLAVVIAKAAYQFDSNGRLTVASEQEPILYSDEYLGDPASSELRLPADLVDFKPFTDVLVIRPKTDLSNSSLKGRRFYVGVGPISIQGIVNNQWEFGPVRRNSKPRNRYAGTYDQAWIDNRMPLLPEDFDARYHQTAPADQIVSGYLNGNEPFRIYNLYAEGLNIEGFLPGRVIVVTGNVLNRYFTELARLDTVLIWLEKPCITLVWRLAIRPKQKFEEVCNVYVDFVRLRTVRELYGKP